MIVVTHGGAGARAEFSDGTTRAAELGLAQADALSAVLKAVCVLEDDPRFNAGTGSNLRLDGRTIELDAAVMTSDGRSGAVACLQHTKNPILVAAEVRTRTPHLLLAGEGATLFARRCGFGPHNVRTEERAAAYVEAKKRALAGEKLDDTRSWGGIDIAKVWNFAADMNECLGDTVGAVARDDNGHFAAGVSTGGTMLALLGRVGDVPIIGGGYYAGPRGAVVCTGEGEMIARAFLAKTVYDLMAQGAAAQAACDRGMTLFADAVGVGVIACDANGGGAASNRSMPSSCAQA